MHEHIPICTQREDRSERNQQTVRGAALEIGFLFPLTESDQSHTWVHACRALLANELHETEPLTRWKSSPIQKQLRVYKMDAILQLERRDVNGGRRVECRTTSRVDEMDAAVLLHSSRKESAR